MVRTCDDILKLLYRYLFLEILIVIFLSHFFLQFVIFIFSKVSYYFLNLFLTTSYNGLVLYSGKLAGELVLENGSFFYIVEECIAPSAYVLISLIFLTLPISFKKIFKILFLALFWFSMFNLIRILFLMWINISFGAVVFDKYHLIFYQGLSGVVTALIIIYYLKKENIRKVYPIFSDIASIILLFKK